MADMKHAFAGNTDPVVLQSLNEHLYSRASHQLEQRLLRIIIVDDIYTTGVRFVPVPGRFSSSAAAWIALPRYTL